MTELILAITLEAGYQYAMRGRLLTTDRIVVGIERKEFLKWAKRNADSATK